MKGNEEHLYDMIEGKKTRFVIPVYQRNYDWQIEHCKQLFDDLVELAKNNLDSHFFGCIVSKEEGTKRIIIDGQQRITTCFLFLLALKHCLQNKLIYSDDDEGLIDDINRDYIIDRRHKDETKLKLKLIKDDQDAFEAVYFGHKDDFINDSNITQNYYYFVKRIKDCSIDADQLNNAFEKLDVIDITLQAEDDAQKIFESLNSTGKDLEEGDKIRNYILMGLSQKEQEEYYNKYWNVIEKNTNYDVSAFIRFWLAAIRRKTPNMKKVYAVFKDYINKNNLNTIDVLKTLKRYSSFYSYIVNFNSESEKINMLLKRIGRLQATVSYPFILNLFNFYYEDNYLDEIEEQNFTEILSILEIYIFRRWVCGVPSNALNKIFETLHNDVMKGLNESNLDCSSYVKVMKRVLLDKDVSGRFPDDKEFEHAIRSRDFYKIRDYKFYLYDKLENENSRERVNIVDGMLNGQYSVEHIMPQKLSPAWKDDLGENAEEIHEQWLNKIANLTLSAYNSEYSNKSFKEKKYNTDNIGFANSGLRMNDYLKTQEEWTEKQLIEREELLVNKFLNLWPMVHTTFTWPKPVTQAYSLADEFECANREIVSFIFADSSYNVSSWKNMILFVISAVYKVSPTSIMKFIPRGVSFPGPYFKSTQSLGFVKIADNVYFNPCNDTQTKLNILKAVFSQANIDESDLVFEVI